MEDNFSKIQRFYLMLKQNDIKPYTAEQIKKLEDMLSNKFRLDINHDIQEIHKKLIMKSQQNMLEFKKKLNKDIHLNPTKNIFDKILKSDEEKQKQKQNKNQDKQKFKSQQSYEQSSSQSILSCSQSDEDYKQDNQDLPKTDKLVQKMQLRSCKNQNKEQFQQKKLIVNKENEYIFEQSCKNQKGYFYIDLQIQELQNQDPDFPQHTNETFLINTMGDSCTISQQKAKLIKMKQKISELTVGCGQIVFKHPFSVAQKSTIGLSFFENLKLGLNIDYHFKQVKIWRCQRN